MEKITLFRAGTTDIIEEVYTEYDVQGMIDVLIRTPRYGVVGRDYEVDVTVVVPDEELNVQTLDAVHRRKIVCQSEGGGKRGAMGLSTYLLFLDDWCEQLDSQSTKQGEALAAVQETAHVMEGILKKQAEQIDGHEKRLQEIERRLGIRPVTTSRSVE